jgi:hypothetical protein
MPKLFVPTPDVVEITWEVFAADTTNTCNVVHILNQNPPTTQLQVDSVIGNLSNWYAVNVMPFVSRDWKFDTATALPLDTAGLDQTIDHAHIVAGGWGDNALPNNCAFRLEKRTGVVGRSFRGCIYQGGVPEMRVDGNTVALDWALLMEAAWASLIPICNGLGWTLVVLSKITGGAPRVTGLVTPVTSIYMKDQIIDAQRGRVHHIV